MYADRMTAAMEQAIGETTRRRAVQIEYNAKHGITPTTIVRKMFDLDPSSGESDYVVIPILDAKHASGGSLEDQIELVRAEMLMAAEALDFEKAARLRDQLYGLEATSRLGPSAKGKPRAASAATASKPKPAKAESKPRGRPRR